MPLGFDSHEERVFMFFCKHCGSVRVSLWNIAPLSCPDCKKGKMLPVERTMEGLVTQIPFSTGKLK